MEGGSGGSEKHVYILSFAGSAPGQRRAASGLLIITIINGLKYEQQLNKSEPYRIGCNNNLINFIEEVEGGGIAFLDGENQSQCYERFLSSTELVHVFHFGILAAERD